jgi:hypothetical protein
MSNPTLVPSTLTGGLLTAKVPVASEVWASVGAVESDVVAHGFELVECPGLGSFRVELGAVVLPRRENIHKEEGQDSWIGGPGDLLVTS